jgi:DNA-binding transcriptional ArsR family regulator
LTIDLRRPESVSSIAASAGGGRLDEIFAALSDPIRRGIVEQLMHGPCTVTRLGAPFEVSAPAISRHLGVLERCGLIARSQVGRVHYCRLLAEPLGQIGAWVEHHQTFWQGKLDSLAEYLDSEGDLCKPSARRES